MRPGRGRPHSGAATHAAVSAEPLPSAPSAAPAPEPTEPPASRSRQPPSPTRLRRSTLWWIRAAAVTATAVLAYQLLVIAESLARDVLSVILFVVFGAVVAFVAGPAVDAMVRWLRLPRSLAILLTLGGGLVLIGLVVYMVSGPVVAEARSLAGQVPGLVGRVQSALDQLTSLLRKHNVPLSGLDLGGSERSITSQVSSLLLSSLTGTLGVLVDMVIVVVVAFWLLKDGDRLRVGLLGSLPESVRVNAEFALDAVGVVIGGYVRAQLFLAVIIGTLAGVGCGLLGVPFPLVIGLVAGVFELIPIVGPFLGGAVALLLAATVSTVLVVATVGLFLGIHVVEGYVLAPRIQARFVQLHPLVALLALFTGAEVAGFLGALFAVPAASLVAVFVRAAIGDIRASRPELYAARRGDTHRARRRQRLLSEFRLFSRSPVLRIRARLRRLLGRRRRARGGRRPGGPSEG
jgi:predicted PurR-regulated permease PerM